MGDRGNIVVQDQGGETYFYSHWGGSGLPLDLKRALAKRWRWNDEPYLARIIFDTMTEGQHGTETGFGISTYQTDNEHPIIRVGGGMVSFDTGQVWTFEEYIALTDDEIMRQFS